MTWEQKGEDKGRWTEFINKITGQSSIREHKPKLVWKSCKEGEHIFQVSGNRELKCGVKKCGVIRTFVPGRDNEYLKSIGIK